MADTLTEFLAKKNTFPKELCGCGCGNPLEKNDPLGPRYAVIEGKNVLINEDCYFAQMERRN